MIGSAIRRKYKIGARLWLETSAGILMAIICEGIPIGLIKLSAGVLPVEIIDNPARWGDGRGEFPWLALDGNHVLNISDKIQKSIEEGRRERLELISSKPHLKLKPLSDNICLGGVIVGLPLHHVHTNSSTKLTER